MQLSPLGAVKVRTWLDPPPPPPLFFHVRQPTIASAGSARAYTGVKKSVGGVMDLRMRCGGLFEASNLTKVQN